MKVSTLFLTIAVLAIMLLAVTGPVRADNVVVGSEESPLEFYTLDHQTAEHTDNQPYKGSLTLTVKNKGATPWTDFHFEIYQVPGGDAVDNVFFDTTAGMTPSWNHGAGFTWLPIDSGAAGNSHTLDLYFASNPVYQNQTVTFTVYTDNTTDEVPIFGVKFYPTTAVPVPGALLLLAPGLAGLIAARKRLSNR